MKIRKLEPNNRLIIAIDSFSLDSAEYLTHVVSPFVDAIKFSNTMLYLNGSDWLPKFRARIRLPIILDLKLAETDFMSKKLIEFFCKLGVDGIIVHSFAGGIAQMLYIAKKYDVVLYMIVNMTTSSMYSSDTRDIKNICSLVEGQPLSGGVVLPASGVETIAAVRERFPSLQILSPGIGAQGTLLGSAITAGADYEIVGRRITEAVNPAEKAANYSSTLKMIEPRILH